MMLLMHARKTNALNFNTLNPKCATAFHLQYDFASHKKKNAQHVFQTEIKDSFAKDFNSASKAKLSVGLKEAETLLVDNQWKLLSSRALEVENSFPLPSVRASDIGALTALGVMATVVFGWAPGFSSGDLEDAELTTLRLIDALQHKFENSASDTFNEGVWDSCSNFFATLKQLNEVQRVLEADKIPKAIIYQKFAEGLHAPGKGY